MLSFPEWHFPTLPCVCNEEGILSQVLSQSSCCYMCVHVSGWLCFTAQRLCSLVSSGAHTPISIDSHPTLEDINKFIVRELAADWKQVATFLGVELSVIRIADTDCHRCEHACIDIFERWLPWKPGTGRKKRTWCTVLSAVEEAGHKAFSHQLQTEVLHLQ